MASTSPGSLHDAHVHTVTGELPASMLGRCLSHVHLLGGPTERPLGIDDNDDLHLHDEMMIEHEMRKLTSAGITTLVEMSCRDFNRSMSGLRRLSESSKIAIIASTGFRNGATARAAGYNPISDDLVSLLVGDVVTGDDGVLAGIIKCGSGKGDMTVDDVRVIEAAAVAQARTGAPISTHTAHGQHAVRQLNILRDAGADLSHVAIGHLDLERDIDVHLEILEQGAYVIYDQIGKVKYLNVDDYGALLERVFEAGFADHVLLSSDFGRQSYLAVYGGTPGLAYVASTFINELEERGLDMSRLEMSLTDNPMRFLTCQSVNCPDESATGALHG